MKKGSGFVSPKHFIGYVDQNKKIPQYVHFRFARLHNRNSLKETGVSYNLQPSLLKQELEHDEISEDSWEKRESLVASS